MSASATRMFVISFLLMLVTGSAAFYVWREQELYGQRIKDGALSLRTWEALQQDAGGEGGLEFAKRLQVLVLESESDAVRFLTYVEELSRQAGVTTVATGLKVVKTKEAGFDDLSASFTVEGDPGSVERMVELLGLLPYRSRIESLSLARRDNASEANVTVLVSVRE